LTQTEAIFQRRHVSRFQSIASVALRPLAQIDGAEELRELAAPPANRLERLKGDQAAQDSVRVKDQYRISFLWRAGDAFEGEMPITKEDPMSREKVDRIPFLHAGETIREDCLKPLGMSVNKLALELWVPATRMTEIVHARRGITADTALRPARYFNTTPEFWLKIKRTVRPGAAA